MIVAAERYFITFTVIAMIVSQRSKPVWTCLGFIALALAFAGCAEQPYYQSQPYYSAQPYPPQGYQPPPPPATATGVVDRIEVIPRGQGGNVAGTVIGGIIGGLIGHQVGSGSGQTAATIAGAAGGAYAGNQVQQRSRNPNETFRVTVRLDNGAYETVVQDDLIDLRPGDRVRVAGGRIYRS
jgi:outer membrane lipoprotein SlyB